jgi:DNA-directed RNA polymerase specialized sigma24 family protein
MLRDPYLAGIHYRISLDRLFTAQEVDEFVALYQNRDTTESDIHRFFSANPKFLYLLGAYNKILSEVSFSGTAKVALGERQCFRLDFLIQHYENIWDVVELKKPTLSGSSLVVGSSSRPRFSRDLQDAIAQVRVYLDELAQTEVQKELEARGIVICRPKAWIIAGRNDDVSVSEKRFLEQSLPHSIQLMTYDDLAELSKQRALIVTKSIQSPLITRMHGESSTDQVELRQNRSTEELTHAVAALSNADFLRLKKNASLSIRGSIGGLDADDLLHEAVVATTEGRRVWKKDVTFLDHLVSVMRSIAVSWRESPRGKSHEPARSETDGIVRSYGQSTSINPERVLSAKDELEQLRNLFAADPSASRVIEFLGLGYSASEIQSRLAISPQAFMAVTNRIRRQIQAMR